MKDILDQMEEHIAAIRNLQRNFDFHSKRLEKLMKALDECRREINCPGAAPCNKSKSADPHGAEDLSVTP